LKKMELSAFEYNTIQKESQAQFRDRGSKFLAFAYPIKNEEEAKIKLKNLKAEHPKANHYCFAYRIGLDGNRFRASDDGEPSGSAGRPILGQIDSAGLTSVLVVVVRYFGGTLLGVPGLIQAYKTATEAALAASEKITRPLERPANLEFDYTMMGDVMTLIKQTEGSILKQDLQLFCRMEVSVPLKNWATFETGISDWHQVKMTVHE